jgi:hypothetical protein
VADRVSYHIGIWGPKQQLEDLVNKALIPRIETHIGLRGIDHFVEHQGCGWISIDEWTFWEDRRHADVWHKGIDDEHRTELMRIATKLGITDDILRRLAPGLKTAAISGYEMA